MPLSCIVIDDEPLAVEILEEYISKIPFLNHQRSFTNAIEALTYFEENSPDLVFLDIQMPELKGTQFARLIQHKNCAIIFTTAYTEFALESYDLNATDYLLKPIEFERFIKAVNKVKEKRAESSADATGQHVETKGYLFVKTDYKIVRIAFNEILYIEGLKDYLIIQTREKKVLTLMRFKTILEQLPPNDFVRVHKSFIIPLSKIESIENHRIKINKKMIPIGKTYQQEFYQKIKFER